MEGWAVDWRAQPLMGEKAERVGTGAEVVIGSQCWVIPDGPSGK